MRLCLGTLFAFALIIVWVFRLCFVLCCGLRLVSTLLGDSFVLVEFDCGCLLFLCLCWFACLFVVCLVFWIIVCCVKMILVCIYFAGFGWFEWLFAIGGCLFAYCFAFYFVCLKRYLVVLNYFVSVWLFCLFNSVALLPPSFKIK